MANRCSGSRLDESREELNKIEASYLQAGGNFFVAEDPATNKVIGHVGIRNEGEGAGILKRMGVLPDYHRHGIGASLVMMALSWTQSQDFSKITLTTGVIENAKPFYERFGFREIGRVLRNRDYVMELVLSETNG
jgi:GNAT superfamily N-acetyltransferase